MQRIVRYKGKEYTYTYDKTVLITREISKEVANACKLLHDTSRPKISLNYMCEEGLKLYLRKEGIKI